MEGSDARPEMPVDRVHIENARALLELHCLHVTARNAEKGSPQSAESPEQRANRLKEAIESSPLAKSYLNRGPHWSLQSDRMKTALRLTEMSMGYYGTAQNVEKTTPELAESLEQRVDQSTEQNDAELQHEIISQDEGTRILVDAENKRKSLEKCIEQSTTSAKPIHKKPSD